MTVVLTNFWRNGTRLVCETSCSTCVHRTSLQIHNRNHTNTLTQIELHFTGPVLHPTQHNTRLQRRVFPNNQLLLYWQSAKCQLLERFASAWPKLIIASHVKGHGKLLHRCSWPPLQLACAAYRLFAHAFQLQRDRMTDITTVLHIASFAFTAANAKKMKKRNMCIWNIIKMAIKSQTQKKILFCMTMASKRSGCILTNSEPAAQKGA